MTVPYSTPIPGASGYAQAALNAKTAYNNALARINERRSGTLRQYGYLADINPETGVTQNMRVDPNNQYGNLQMMLRNQGLDAQSAEYDNEERGVRGGLANKLFSRLKFDWGGQSAQLGQALTGALGGLQDEQNQAAYARDRALWEAEQAAAQEAIMKGWFNPAGGDGGGGNSGGSGGGDDGGGGAGGGDHDQTTAPTSNLTWTTPDGSPPSVTVGGITYDWVDGKAVPRPVVEPQTMNEIVRARPALTAAAKVVANAKKKKKK